MSDSCHLLSLPSPCLPSIPPRRGTPSFLSANQLKRPCKVRGRRPPWCVRPHSGLTVVGSNEVQDGGLLEGTSVLAALTLATAGVHKKGSKESGLVWSKGTKEGDEHGYLPLGCCWWCLRCPRSQSCPSHPRCTHTGSTGWAGPDQQPAAAVIRNTHTDKGKSAGTSTSNNKGTGTNTSRGF